MRQIYVFISDISISYIYLVEFLLMVFIGLLIHTSVHAAVERIV
jgi:hypothetical protein